MAKFLVTFCQKIADSQQFLALRHIHSGKNEKLFGREMEIKARSGGLCQSLKIKRRGNVRLVRALVFGEAGIAVNAEHRFPYRRHVPRTELGELAVYRIH